MITIPQKILAALMLSAISLAQAEIKMPSIFSDSMILQAQMPVKVWGHATPNSKVKVEFAGQIKDTLADSDGNWQVVLPAMDSSKNPRKMTVSENEGSHKKEIYDVLIGEVWILGGQSNMAWCQNPTLGWKDAAKNANYPNLRCFRQPKAILPDEYCGKKFSTFEKTSLCTVALARTPQKQFPQNSHWELATPESVQMWSAIGFYFAERLMKDLDTPVGIIFTPLGGSPMIAWIPESDCDKNEYLKKKRDEFNAKLKNWDESGYHKALDQHERKIAERISVNKKLKADGKRPKTDAWRYYLPPTKESPYTQSATPFYNYNAKVAPLAGLSARGILWYQGESDAGGESLKNFSQQLEILIDAWRKTFENTDMPFIQAQISSFDTKADWPTARAKQLAAAQNRKNVYTVCTIDIGNKKDVHPANKSAVGERMEKIALAKVYDRREANALSPIMKSTSYKGNSATVQIETYGRKLTSRQAENGFEVLAEGKWQPAIAKLEGDIITITYQEGKNIGGVRYLWKSYPQKEASIFNEDGLPLFPFSNEIK